MRGLAPSHSNLLAAKMPLRQEENMNNADVEFVQSLYAAFGRRDIATVLNGLSPEVTWNMVGRVEDVPMAGVHRGMQGVADFFRIMAETLEITRFEPREFHAVDNRVFVHGFWRYVARSSGQSGENEWLHVFTLRDGKVTAWRGHNDTAQISAVLSKPAAVGTPRGLIETLVSAFQRGDIPFIIDHFSDDCVLRETESRELPYRGVFEGKTGATQFFTLMGEVFTPHKLAIDTWVCQGDRVVAQGVWGGLAHATGKAWESHIALTFRVHDGKVVEFRGYDDTAVTVAALRS
jgi:ketosteroid isomerase-like protein